MYEYHYNFDEQFKINNQFDKYYDETEIDFSISSDLKNLAIDMQDACRLAFIEIKNASLKIKDLCHEIFTKLHHKVHEICINNNQVSEPSEKFSAHTKAIIDVGIAIAITCVAISIFNFIMFPPLPGILWMLNSILCLFPTISLAFIHHKIDMVHRHYEFAEQQNDPYQKLEHYSLAAHKWLLGNQKYKNLLDQEYAISKKLLQDASTEEEIDKAVKALRRAINRRFGRVDFPNIRTKAERVQAISKLKEDIKGKTKDEIGMIIDQFSKDALWSLMDFKN